MDPTLVQALRVQALVLSKQERWEEAENALQEALTLCRSMAAPYAEAKTLYTAGLVSHKKGELETSRQRFEAALMILEQLGERLYARSIEQLLGQENTGEQNLTLESSQQLDSRGVYERESASRSSRLPETSNRHISIDSPPGQASGPVGRG
jgi:tetratricopeptide (TPR) repeat protein